MECDNKKIFVTGGTGFVGSALTKELVKNGAEVYILTRDTNKKNLTGIVYVFSIADIQKIQPDIIINLAGEPISQRWTSKSKKEIIESRLKITTELVAYIKSAQNKPDIFISGSAVGYYGNDLNYEFIEESSPNTKVNTFASEVCSAWENVAWPASDSIRLVLLRIGIVLEKNGGILSKLLPIFRLGLGSHFGTGKQWMSWIDLDDLVQVILFCIKNENIKGPVNTTSPNPVTNLQFVKEMARALHRPAIFCMPSFVIKMMSGQMGEELILNGQKVFPNKLIQSKFTFNYPTLSLAFNKIFNRR